MSVFVVPFAFFFCPDGRLLILSRFRFLCPVAFFFCPATDFLGPFGEELSRSGPRET